MSPQEMSLADIVDVLRAEGTDVTHIEAKRASSYPENIRVTLSAFANTPGGGVIVLGLDESNDFAAVGVDQPVTIKRRLANQSRQAVTPPLGITTSVEAFEGVDVVVARVPELPAAAKPCRVGHHGPAYLRAYDGDYPISTQEEQAFIANRGTPVFDRGPVPGSSVHDLDADLLAAFLDSCRSHSARLANEDDATVLRRMTVTTAEGTLSVAGLYALGAYPQQFHPSLRIVARAAATREDPPGTRTNDLAALDGPLPALLEQALAWVRRNTAARVRFGTDGHGFDEPTYPAEAVRELVANALVHRDLGPHALGEAVNLTLEEDRLAVTNPGGLWGLTVDQLGRTAGGITRNQGLYSMCRDVRTTGNRRVVEGVGSGIEAIRNALAGAGMTPPAFKDMGVRFTAIVPSHALLASEDLEWLAQLPGVAGLGDVPRHVLATMRTGTRWSNRSLRRAFPMDSTRARALLLDLVNRSLVTPSGDGRARTYGLSQSVMGGGRARSETPVPRTVQPRSLENERRLIESLVEAPLTLAEMMRATQLTERQVRYALDRLIASTRVVRHGGPGLRNTRYSLAEIQP